MTGGGQRIGRSQSATSLQIQQLEDVIGQRLFERHGRGVVLAPAGELLRPVARDVIQSLDKTLADLRGEGLQGRLRIGMPDDHSRFALAKIISDFAAIHDNVELDVQCSLGIGFDNALSKGVLDLAVFEVPSPGQTDYVLSKGHLRWVGRADKVFDDGQPLPVALFDRACWWRDLALASLEEAGRSFQIVFTSESSTGVRAAIEAGFAVGMLSAMDDLSGLTPIAGFDAPHPTYLVLKRGRAGNTPACDAMCDAIRQAFQP